MRQYPKAFRKRAGERLQSGGNIIWLLYQWRDQRKPIEENIEVRSAIQQIFTQHQRRYDYRRMSAERHRRGTLVHHKRVPRLLREDQLLAVQSQSFVVTTNSEHELEVYLNLASWMKLTGIIQLWTADITYLWLSRELCGKGATLSRRAPIC